MTGIDISTGAIERRVAHLRFVYGPAHHDAALLEALAAQRDELQAKQTYRYIGKDGKPILAKTLEDQRDEARAKLAKAVEAAEEMSAAFYSNGNVTERHLRACKAGVKLDATLAEIKGESHDPL